MTRYLPHTHGEIQEMLKTIGAESIQALYRGVPDDILFSGDLDLPSALAEPELRKHLREISEQNISVLEARNFIGAGAYHHTVPAVIRGLVKRGEFLTAYTPYQPEVSQGTLQAIFEYQTMACELTGLEIANASNYDLSTACAEAALMAKRVTGRKRVLVSNLLHPHYRTVMRSSLKYSGMEIVEIPYATDGRINVEILKKNLDENTAGVFIQSPNFFGVIEDVASFNKVISEKGALLILAASEPLSYAVLNSPGELGADIAIAEGMSFGIGLNYGGPYLGIFATKEKMARSMPGRLVGETVDSHGKRGYVLTLSTREQHIRREKATSNICTNQGLCALMATIYLSLMGPQGLKELALVNMSRLQFFINKIRAFSPDALMFSSPQFNETVIRLKVPAKEAVVSILKDGIFPGVDLSTYYSELDRHLLVCTTEMNTEEDIETLVERLRNFI